MSGVPRVPDPGAAREQVGGVEVVWMRVGLECNRRTWARLSPKAWQAGVDVWAEVDQQVVVDQGGAAPVQAGPPRAGRGRSCRNCRRLRARWSAAEVPRKVRRMGEL